MVDSADYAKNEITPEMVMNISTDLIKSQVYKKTKRLLVY
jgi:hypothetical protein